MKKKRGCFLKISLLGRSVGGEKVINSPVLKRFRTNVAGDLFRFNNVNKFFMDLHPFVGGEELPARRALYIFDFEVHALDVGV